MWLSFLILTLYFVLYAVVHSLLAGLPAKNLARRIFGPAADRWYRLFYNFFAVVTLLPLFFLLAVLPDKTLYVVPTPWRWLFVAAQLLALLGLVVSFLQTDPFYFVGITQLFTKNSDLPFTVSGLYNWVRHPIYSFSILFIWLTPAMSVNLAMTYILFTFYFYLGSIYEEKRLIKELGANYQEYQQRVPRLVPLPGRRYQ